MFGVCDTYCEGCEYLAKSNDVYCDYNSIVGHKRPCKAGMGCTERRRPAKYRHDPRLASLEKATLEAARRKAPPKKKPKQEKCGRSRAEHRKIDEPGYQRELNRRRVERVIQEGTYLADSRAIIRWRRSQNLSQRALGKLIGVSASAICQWEKGVSEARWPKLEALGCKRPAS